jgi:hypothetical protein
VVWKRAPSLGRGVNWAVVSTRGVDLGVEFAEGESEEYSAWGELLLRLARTLWRAHAWRRRGLEICTWEEREAPC